MKVGSRYTNIHHKLQTCDSSLCLGLFLLLKQRGFIDPDGMDVSDEARDKQQDSHNNIASDNANSVNGNEIGNNHNGIQNTNSNQIINDKSSNQGNKGRTIYLNRGPLDKKLSTKYLNVWPVFLTQKIGDGEETLLLIPGLPEKLYMIGNAEEDERGDNDLNYADELIMKDERMPSHSEYDITFRITDFGVFLHEGYSIGAFLGCKGLASEFEGKGKDYSAVENFHVRDLVLYVREINRPPLIQTKLIFRNTTKSREQFSTPKTTNIFKF